MNLKSVWLWIKHYWYVPVLIIGIIVLFFFGKSDKLLDVLKIKTKAYEDEKEAVEKFQEEERIRLREVEKKYHRAVWEVERKYIADGKVLSEEEKKRIKELSEKSLEELNARLKEEFGL